MGPLAAITTSYRKVFTYSGRAPRSEFWWFFLALLVASTLIQTALASEPGHLRLRFSLNFYIGTEATWIENLFTVVGLPPFIAVLTRRLHDVSRPGYHALIGFAVFAALIGGPVYLGINKVPTAPLLVVGLVFAWLVYVIYVLAKKSDPENRYGAPPFKALQQTTEQHQELPR
jgi:uncharacterized membrane protein YhaH (DUF805 family)